MRIGRRQLFRAGAWGGGAGLLGALAWPAARQKLTARPTYEPGSMLPADCDGTAKTAGPDGYRAMYAPAGYIGANALDGRHTPPPRRNSAPGSVLDVDLPVIETTQEVADGRNVRVWAYGGSVPGPILRATVGDPIAVTLRNLTSGAHSIHFHGTHDVMQDGLTRVAPGGTERYEFIAGPAGFHPYHCHIPPYALHTRKGMYGALIVDPVEGRPPAHEFVLCLCGFDVDGHGRNDTYAWNGIAGFYERYPLKVPVGERVRLYVMNMVENDSFASFHLHANTFDVYRSGTSRDPSEHTDIVSLGPAERAILEFTLPKRGRYMFHPHQSHMAERGAMGWIAAV
jgi:nitrite reductase (NO-forming)